MMNSNEKYAENFVKSEAGKLLAEVFFRELQFISGMGHSLTGSSYVIAG